MPELFVHIVIITMAACIGSFLNVCIFRMPERLSIVSPPSACPSCKREIAFYDNIPVLSYFILGAKCRHCKAPIHWRYPFIEALAAAFAVALYYRHGLTLDSLIYFGLISALIVVTFTDLDRRIIPNLITLPAIPVGFLLSFVLKEPGYMASAMGVALGGGSLLLIAWLYSLVTGKEGMGGGDIKLLAMIGAFLGWQGVLLTLVVSSFFGALVGVIFLARSDKGSDFPVPFGPFLSLGAATYIFGGPNLIDLYIRLLWI